MAKKRKSGTGTVRQRGDGRWEGRVVIGYDDSGLPKTKNVLAKTKRECQEKLRQLTESMVGRNDRKVKPDMQFGDWLCHWYETHSKPTLRASTQNNYENVIHNHVLPEIGKIPLNKLSQNDLQQFYLVAPPQMAKYIEISTQIYNVYLKYIAPEDIYVYSRDEQNGQKEQPANTVNGN